MRRIFTKIISLSLALVACTLWDAGAQNKTTVSISGSVVTKESGKTKTPIPYAVVSLPEIGVATTTNLQGEFEIKSLAPGTYKIEISSLGYEKISTTVDAKATVTNLSYAMVETSFRLDNIVVSAQESKAGAATATKISRAAMDHLMTTSLADIMSLLPGEAVTRPDLTYNQATGIRGGQSFGTAIIMDGSPLSNNANLQVLTMTTGSQQNTALPGSTQDEYGTTVYRQNTPTSGFDLRNITTDNIESVEVIRGIASVEYGDITSGAVIVNTKAGHSPLAIKFNTNPNVYMFSATQGFNLSPKAGGGSINYGADYTYNVADPTQGYDFYQRVTGRVGYTNTLFDGKFYTNSVVNFIYSKDKGEPNPDDADDLETFNERDLGIRFNTNGTLNFNKGWFKNIKYNASVSYTNKRTYYEDELTNADYPYSTAMTDGATISSIPGRHIYDEDGSEVTNFTDAEAGKKAWVLPGSYKSQYNVYGKELNTYAKLLATFAGKLGPTNHRILIGGDFRNSGNLGQGRVFDPEYPPYRNVSYQFAGHRERSYKDIPFLNHLGAFAEESFRWTFARRELNIVAGVRYDHVVDFKGGWSPRLNASLDILPEQHLSVRGGYGITMKAPSVALLSPDNAYFDMLNFDNSSSYYAEEAQMYQLVTTRVFNTHNPDLQMAKAKKWEVGLDFRIGQVRGYLTWYRDKCLNGYTFGSTPSSFRSVKYVQYEEGDVPDDGTTLPQPVLEASNDILVEYTMPTNNYAYQTEGIEAEIDFGRIDAIRTSFSLNGAWTRHKSWTNNYTFWNRTTGTDYATYPHMGVFEPGNDVSHHESIITNLRITHNIPKIDFIVTLTANVIWKDNLWHTYGNDSIPVKYISKYDGQMYDLDPSKLGGADPEFNGLDRYNYLNERRHLRERNRPPLLCMNINLTKEIGQYLRVSFFANNMFRSMPYFKSNVDIGTRVRRNRDKFFFGVELSALIK